MRIWHTQFDSRTRKSHRLAEGQKVAVGETFRVGAAQLALPSDTSPQGDESETYGCRCFVEYAAQESVQQLEVLQQELKDRFNFVPLPRDFDDEETQEHYDLVRQGLGRRHTVEEQVIVLEQFKKGLEQFKTLRDGIIDRRIEELNIFDPDRGLLRIKKKRDLFGDLELYVSDQEVAGAEGRDAYGLTWRPEGPVIPITVILDAGISEEEFKDIDNDEGLDKNFFIVHFEDDSTPESFIGSQARHELGHAIADGRVPDVFQELFDITTGVSTFLRETISVYAASNPDEAVAEAFAWYTSPDYPRNIPHGSPGAEKRMSPEIERAVEDLLIGF